MRARRCRRRVARTDRSTRVAKWSACSARKASLIMKSDWSASADVFRSHAIGGDERLIEDGQERDVVGAPGGQIDAAAECLRGVGLVSRSDGDHSVGTSLDQDRRAAAGLVEIAAGGQDRVAHRFGFDPAQTHSPEQLCCRDRSFPASADVALACCRLAARRLAIGRREGHQSDQRFQSPATCDELGAEPFEQLGMRWGLALNAEIVLRGDDAFGEEVCPDAVDHHARQQCGRRRIGLSEPAGQGGAAAAGAFEWRRRCCDCRIIRRAEHAEESRRHLGAGCLLVAAQEQVRGRGRADVVEGLDLAPLAPASLGGADAARRACGRNGFFCRLEGCGDFLGFD